MEDTTSNKAMIPSNFVYLFPLNVVYFLRNMISSFLLGSWYTYGFLIVFVRYFGVQCGKQKDGSFGEDLGNEEAARVDEETNDDDDGCCLLGKDIDLVMRRLGIQEDGVLEEGEMHKRWRCDEISRVFEEEEEEEEEEVREIEMKEAFDVFDQDKDGFIDARELQRVLIALGFRQQEAEFKACREMIRGFDSNGDGKIDFHEFVNLLSFE